MQISNEKACNPIKAFLFVQHVTKTCLQTDETVTWTEMDFASISRMAECKNKNGRMIDVFHPWSNSILDSI